MTTAQAVAIPPQFLTGIVKPVDAHFNGVNGRLFCIGSAYRVSVRQFATADTYRVVICYPRFCGQNKKTLGVVAERRGSYIVIRPLNGTQPILSRDRYSHCQL
jgi:hypothetical protein